MMAHLKCDIVVLQTMQVNLEPNMNDNPFEQLILAVNKNQLY